jgi:hypothetical protein
MIVFLPMVLQIPQDYASFFALQNYASHDKAPFISYIVDLCFKKRANLVPSAVTLEKPENPH